LTRRLGDHPEGEDERFKNMEQVVRKLHNLPEQMRISANEMAEQEVPLKSDLFAQTYPGDPLSNKILKAIRQEDSLKDITVAECTEQEGQV
jgi:hypothetical protein